MEAHKDIASKAAAAARERRDKSSNRQLSHLPAFKGCSWITSENNNRQESTAQGIAAEAALFARQRNSQKEGQPLSRPPANISKSKRKAANAAANAAVAVAIARQHKSPTEIKVEGSGAPHAAALARRKRDDNVLVSLILSFEWQSIPLWCQTNPEDAEYIDPISGVTPLHLICSIGSAPTFALTAVLHAWVGATQVKNRKYGETPLHLQCRNSQITLSKAAALINQAPETASLLNKDDQSPLHIACQSNAMFPILKMLVQASPSMLKQRNRFGDTPLTSLWGSYSQSIPGQLSLCRVKMGLPCDEGHFQRFWAKAEFLALESYFFASSLPSEKSNDKLLAHAIICTPGCPRLMLDIALRINPDLASILDTKQNYPLHSVLLRKEPMYQQRDALKLLLTLFESAAKYRDHEGVLPLHRAIKKGISWNGGLSDIMKAAPDAMDLRDRGSCLFPFMLAASVRGGDDAALSDSFALLTARPDVVGYALLS